MDEFERKAKLIEEILDKIKPIPEGTSEAVRDAIDAERQFLVMRAGWNKMSVEELEMILGGSFTFTIIGERPKRISLEYFG